MALPRTPNPCPECGSTRRTPRDVTVEPLTDGDFRIMLLPRYVSAPVKILAALVCDDCSHVALFRKNP